MLSIQQMIKVLRQLQNGASAGDLLKCLRHAAANMPDAINDNSNTMVPPALVTSLLSALEVTPSLSTSTSTSPKQQQQQYQPQSQTLPPSLPYMSSDSSQHTQVDCQTSHSGSISLTSNLDENSSLPQQQLNENSTQDTSNNPQQQQQQQQQATLAATAAIAAVTNNTSHLQRSQQIQNFYQQQLLHFHTQHNRSLYAKQKQTQFAMSSLAAEPLALKPEDIVVAATKDGSECCMPDSGAAAPAQQSNASAKPCFNTGLADILQFMELIGNLKHTKRTGWVLRDVNDCESISGHMYRMSMMTFLLDGSEGLNPIRCMELALVHDLAESLVGDITPFCGVSKEQKRSMEFKAMEDICKLIEPRGKRIMDLFEEYEHGQSAESKFVKDLDRLDMVMQAFEYEKRDNCLLKHQEFFDSTEGKFNHPFVKKLVNEIYEQRKSLAKDKGATPPPAIQVPSMDVSNGHCAPDANLAEEQANSRQSSS